MISIANKCILVTGATGFIGGHLCRKLQEAGGLLHGVSRRKVENNTSDITWWQGDLSDLTFTREVMKQAQPDIVFHLASHVVGLREVEAVQSTFHANLHSVVNLLSAASESGCRRIILIGSQEEPDFSMPSDTIPSSPYAAAKWAASSYARMFHALYDCPVSIARVFMVYGPGQKDIRKLVPYTILSLLKGATPHLTSGERPVDWIYAQDVADGLIAMACAEDLNGKTVDLGTGSLVTIREIVETIARLVGNDVKPEFGSKADRLMEQVRKARIRDTFDQIRWKPGTSLEEGLMSTINWYREHPEG